MNNEMKITAKEKVSSTEVELDTFLFQHNIDKIIRKTNIYKSAKGKKLNITSDLKSVNKTFSYYIRLNKQIKKIQDICNKNSSILFQNTIVSSVVTPDENDSRISNLQVVDVTDKTNTTSSIITQLFYEDNNTNTPKSKCRRKQSFTPYNRE